MMSDKPNAALNEHNGATAQKRAYELTGRVYYDGACSLCNKEISQLKSASNTLDYRNIHQIADGGDEARAIIQALCLAPDTSLAALQVRLLSELHSFDSQGKVLRGLDANIYMWADAGHRLRAKFFGFRLVKPLAHIIYRWWSNKRYCDLYQNPR